MRKVVLYLGMSLDGYIADKNGGVGQFYDNLTQDLIIREDGATLEKMPP